MWTAFSDATFGRREELRLIRDFLSYDHRASAVLLITGSPGMGKTHLLREVRAEAESRGYEWLHGSGAWVPGVAEQAAAYGPLREACRGTDLLDAIDGPIPGPAQVEPLVYRQQRFTTAMARRGRVVVAVDDLQWTDRSSLAMILHLVHHSDSDVLLVLASRPVPVDQRAGSLIEHLKRRIGTTQIELAPLPDAVISELIEASAHLSTSRRDEIVSLAGGSPLAALELARKPHARIPPTVAALARQRLISANAAAAKAAAVAAVLGEGEGTRTFRDVLARVGVEAVDEAIGGAVQAELLWPNEEGYGFAHPLEREAIYSALLPDERRRIHAAVADVLALDDPTPDRLARVAVHRSEAFDDAATITASLAAARAAAEVGAYPEALVHQARALSAARRTSAASIDVDIDLDAETLRAAELARWARRPEEGLRLLHERLAIPDCTAAPLWAKVGWLRREIGDAVGAGVAYNNALNALGEVSDAVRADVLAEISTWQMIQSHNAAALASCNAGLELLDPGPSATRAHLLITRGVLLADCGRTEEGLQLLEEGRKVARAVSDEWALWRYVGNVTYVLENAGELEAAVDVAMRAYERARAAHIEHSLTVLPTALNAVVGLTELLRFDEARVLSEHLLDGAPPASWRALLLAAVALGRARQGQVEGATELVVAALDAAGDDADDLLKVRIATAQAEIALAAGNAAQARWAVDRAIAAATAIEDEDHLGRALATAFLVEHFVGADPRRLAILASQRPQWESPHALHARLCDIEVDSSAGPSQMIEDEWAAIARDGKRVDPLRAIYAHLRQAEAALSRKDRRTAAAIVSAAQQQLAGTGPTFIGEQLQRLAILHHLRVTTDIPAERAIPASSELGLTRREIEVLGMLVEGASNRQIARTLGVTEKTASVHVSRVIRKLGVSTRLEAATRAHLEHLL